MNAAPSTANEAPDANTYMTMDPATMGTVAIMENIDNLIANIKDKVAADIEAAKKAEDRDAYKQNIIKLRDIHKRLLVLLQEYLKRSLQNKGSEEMLAMEGERREVRKEPGMKEQLQVYEKHLEEGVRKRIKSETEALQRYEEMLRMLDKPGAWAWSADQFY